MPKVNILDAADRIDDVSGSLNTLSERLKTRIDEAQKNGKDVSALLAESSDMQTKITGAQTQAQNAQDAVINLDPSGFPGNRNGLETGRSDARAGRDDVFTAIKDAESIIKGLRAFDAAGTSTTGTTAAPGASAQ